MRTTLLAVALAAACFSASACGGGAGSPDGGAPISPLITARPYRFKVPSGYDRSRPTPLVLLLHGYGASGALQDAYFGLSAHAEANTLLLAVPDGTLNDGGQLYWAATDGCCGSGVDDVAYLAAVIDDMKRQFNVDAKRVFVMGHSNGGFMANRLACELAPRIAAIVSLAGANWKDVSRCRPARPVAVLQVHGDLDSTIRYEGAIVPAGGVGGTYPSAHETVGGWAAFNGCTGPLASAGANLDLVSNVAGDETRVEAYGGCRENGAVELWTIAGGGHIPALPSASVQMMLQFLAAHPQP